MKGEDFKRLRLAVGLTRRALSLKFGCSENTIYQWEVNINKLKRFHGLALLKVIDDIKRKTMA